MSSIGSFFQSRDNHTKRFLFSVFWIILLASSASIIQSDLGDVEVKTIEIITNQGASVTGKLYIPNSATNNTPAPAVLLLHGLNNDKDTEAPAAIELSRRGFVALTLDESGHGDSERGDSLLEATDETLGGNAAYNFLKVLEFVRDDRIGLIGHSMGGTSALAVAELNPDHKAIALQAFGPQNLSDHGYVNNYLQIWPRYEESAFVSRDEYIDNGLEMIQYNLDLYGFALREDGYDETYGSFADGSAQRYALVSSTHPGGTWKSDSVKEVVAWMKQALADQIGDNALYDEASNQIYYLKEVLTLLALLFSFYSLVPLVERLLKMEYFSTITQEVPQTTYYKDTDWWKIAGLNATLGGITYLIIPQIGLFLTIIIPGFTQIFSLAVANAFLFWFLLNAGIAHFLFRRWYRKQEGISPEDLGGISKESEKRDLVIKRSVILAAIVFAYLYLLSAFIQIFFLVELRYMWPFFRILQPYRMIMFFVYFFPVFYFFLINGGYFLFGQARVLVANADTPKGLVMWWLYNVINMLGVLIIIFLLEYLPMFLFGTGPLFGGLLEFWWLFGIFLMQIIPAFLVIFLLQTVLFRRTGRIYIGSMLSAMIITWVISNGALA